MNPRCVSPDLHARIAEFPVVIRGTACSALAVHSQVLLVILYVKEPGAVHCTSMKPEPVAILARSISSAGKSSRGGWCGVMELVLSLQRIIYFPVKNSATGGLPRHDSDFFFRYCGRRNAPL
jgi:hypothetical protein